MKRKKEINIDPRDNKKIKSEGLSFEGKEELIEDNLNISTHPVGQNESSKMLLHQAVRAGNKDQIKQLILEGWDPESKDDFGKTPLQLAADIFSDLTLFESDETLDPEEIFNALLPLHLAIANKDENATNTYLSCNNPLLILSQNLDGETPLHIAVKVQDQILINRLLEQGAILDAQDKSGKTPLFVAVEQGNIPLIKFLFQQGANLKCKDNCTASLLHLAVEQSNIKLTRFLLHRAPDLIIEKDFKGNQPLHLLARTTSFKLELFYLLLKYDALSNIGNDLGNTPFHIFLETHGNKLTDENFRKDWSNILAIILLLAFDKPLNLILENNCSFRPYDYRGCEFANYNFESSMIIKNTVHFFNLIYKKAIYYFYVSYEEEEIKRLVKRGAPLYKKNYYVGLDVAPVLSFKIRKDGEGYFVHPLPKLAGIFKNENEKDYRNRNYISPSALLNVR